MSAGGVKIAPGRNLSGESEDPFDAACLEDPFDAAGFEDCIGSSCFAASWFIADSWSGWLVSRARHRDSMRFVALRARQGEDHDPTFESGGALVGINREGQRDRPRERAVHPFLP